MDTGQIASARCWGDIFVPEHFRLAAETEAIRRGARVRFQRVRDSLAFVVLGTPTQAGV
jgi:hypothetical protein